MSTTVGGLICVGFILGENSRCGTTVVPLLCHCGATAVPVCWCAATFAERFKVPSH